MLHSKEIEVLIDRECCEVYLTWRERAAYRAGMSTASAACDYVVREMGSRNYTKREMGRAAKLCGDMIAGLRGRVHVPMTDSLARGMSDDSDPRAGEPRDDQDDALHRLDPPLTVAALRSHIAKLEAEVDTLQRAVVTYGDRARMSNAADMVLQQTIDRAFAASFAASKLIKQ
jgi:hypothetical protein